MGDRATLWQRYKEGADPTARRTLIMAYAPLVRYVAGRLAAGLPKHIEVTDLESYGFLGLFEAVERFDPDRGIKFETYATQRVRGAIIDGLRADTWAPALRQRARQLEEVYGQVEAELGRPPTDADLAKALNISVTELGRRLADVGAAVLISIDEVSPGHRAGASLGELLPDPHSLQPEDEALANQRRAILADAIAKLPEKERQVTALFYYEELTVGEIAEVMGLSSARISQLHSKAILRLRGRLARMKKELTAP